MNAQTDGRNYTLDNEFITLDFTNLSASEIFHSDWYEMEIRCVSNEEFSKKVRASVVEFAEANMFEGTAGAILSLYMSRKFACVAIERALAGLSRKLWDRRLEPAVEYYWDIGLELKIPKHNSRTVHIRVSAPAKKVAVASTTGALAKILAVAKKQDLDALYQNRDRFHG